MSLNPSPLTRVILAVDVTGLSAAASAAAVNDVCSTFVVGGDTLDASMVGTPRFFGTAQATCSSLSPATRSLRLLSALQTPQPAGAQGSVAATETTSAELTGTDWPSICAAIWAATTTPPASAPPAGPWVLTEALAGNTQHLLLTWASMVS